MLVGLVRRHCVALAAELARQAPCEPISDLSWYEHLTAFCCVAPQMRSGIMRERYFGEWRRVFPKTVGPACGVIVLERTLRRREGTLFRVAW